MSHQSQYFLLSRILLLQSGTDAFRASSSTWKIIFFFKNHLSHSPNFERLLLITLNGDMQAVHSQAHRTSFGKPEKVEKDDLLQTRKSWKGWPTANASSMQKLRCPSNSKNPICAIFLNLCRIPKNSSERRMLPSHVYGTLKCHVHLHHILQLYLQQSMKGRQSMNGRCSHHCTLRKTAITTLRKTAITPFFSVLRKSLLRHEIAKALASVGVYSASRINIQKPWEPSQSTYRALIALQLLARQVRFRRVPPNVQLCNSQK